MGIVEDWIADQNRPSTKRQFKFHFKKFWNWIQKEQLFETPKDLLDDYESKTGRAKHSHVVYVKQYMRWLKVEKDYSINSRITALTSIRSFYNFNNTPFPKVTRSDRRKMFEPTEKEIQKALGASPVKVKDLRDTLMVASEPYRTILQIMYQSGMALAEFQYFNRHGWTQIKDQLYEKGPIKIRLVRRKTLETNVNVYYTFLGEEGKEAIKRWLRIRESKFGLPEDDEPIFITIQKRNGKIGAPVNVTIQQNLVNAMKKAGVVPKSSKGPYDLHPHELRDMFKSMCTLAGVKNVASEFFLGHTIDRLGYDKSPKYDIGFFEKEYLKVEPKLNLWSQQLKTISREEIRTEVIGALMGKIDDAELAPIAQKLGISPQQIRSMIRRIGWKGSEGETEALLETERTARNNGNGNNFESKMITEGELCGCINDGWEIVRELTNGKIVVKRPKSD